MASYYLTRNPSASTGPDNALNSANRSARWFSQSYGTTGASDVVFTPDTEEVGVSVANVGCTYSIELSMDPPSAIEAGSASWVSPTALTGLTDSYAGAIEGSTAVRINISVLGTAAKFSVRA